MNVLLSFLASLKHSRTTFKWTEPDFMD